MCIARYTLAVDRRFKREGQDGADFIPCVVFGKGGEFVEKYCKKGTKLAVTGRIQTGSYTNKEGQKVYTTEIVVEEQEFAESKAGGQQNTQPAKEEESMDGFTNIPEGIDEEELPFA
jgi:single-strand DNA-binding protein